MGVDYYLDYCYGFQVEGKVDGKTDDILVKAYDNELITYDETSRIGLFVRSERQQCGDRLHNFIKEKFGKTVYPWTGIEVIDQKTYGGEYKPTDEEKQFLASLSNITIKMNYYKKGEIN